MLIDWFTVGAQALNFVILVWLLQHFLYHPILRAIDAREKGIAAKLADAVAKEAAAQRERDDFQHKNEDFDRQRAALLAKATDEAKAEGQRLLDAAHHAADTVATQREQKLKTDATRPPAARAPPRSHPGPPARLRPGRAPRSRTRSTKPLRPSSRCASRPRRKWAAGSN